jgi:hypothetical protein
MLEWMFGFLGVALAVVVVLVYFEAIDLADLIGGLLSLLGEVVRLIAGLLFAVVAFFVWLVKRSRSSREP